MKGDYDNDGSDSDLREGNETEGKSEIFYRYSEPRPQNSK